MDLQTPTTLIHLLDNALVQFRAITDPVTQVVVTLGRLFAAHDPNGRDEITVDTGSAAVVALDTRFSVEVSAQETYINVRDGKGVSVTLKNQSLVLVPGQQIRFARNATALPLPEPLDPAELTRWNQVLALWSKTAGALPPSVAAPVTLPPAPVPTTSGPGGAVGCSFTLTWNPVAYPGPLAYTVELERQAVGTAGFVPWQRVEKITATSYAVPPLSNGSFQAQWRVWASGNGVVGAASAWQPLNVQCIP
jgi:hypothetical protein